MKLKVGLSYKNRRGEVVTIVKRWPNINSPFADAYGNRYNEEGRWFRADIDGSPYDLIELV